MSTPQILRLEDFSQEGLNREELEAMTKEQLVEHALLSEKLVGIAFGGMQAVRDVEHLTGEAIDSALAAAGR